MNILKLIITKGGNYDVSPKNLLASQLPHGLAHVAEHLRDDFELSTHNGDERFVARGVRTSLLSVFGTSRAAGDRDLDDRISMNGPAVAGEVRESTSDSGWSSETSTVSENA